MVLVEVCELCYTGKGECKEAVAQYQPSPVSSAVSVCEDCKKIVEEAEYETWEIGE